MLKAPINKIIGHTLVDGSGNRTAVFFQGCNIECRYCHNPETQKLCLHCQACIDQCPVHALTFDNGRVVWDENACAACDTCTGVCPNHSSPKAVEMTVEEVFAAIHVNLPFIRGITVSGGECSLYLEFLEELFKKCKKIGLTCYMDSNGIIPLWKHSLMKVCDGVMLDVKAWSDEKFFALTGAHNDTLKENLRELAMADKLQELRVVCLDGWVDAEDVIAGIGKTVSETVKEAVLLKLICFRNKGVKGELKHAAAPSMDDMGKLKKAAEHCGFRNVKII